MKDKQHQIGLFEDEIELQESNYHELIRSHPNYNELKLIREKIKELKKQLNELTQ